MPAPTPTARGTPTGWKMPDGYQALITFASRPNINLWEKQVKPPAIDTGGLINTTTMLNKRVRTMWPKKLVTFDPITIPCAYDPDTYNDLMNFAGSNDVITIKWADGTTLAFWGSMIKFDPGELVEGEYPAGAVEVGPTNADNSQTEQMPVLTPAVGT